MSKTNIIIATEKLMAVKEYLNGEGSTYSIGKKYGVSNTTIRRWLAQYQSQGETAFSKQERMGSNYKVSPEDKLKAVKDYLAGKGTIDEISAKYNVSYSPFRRWIAKYKAFGEKAFLRNGRNTVYSSDFKQNVIREYLSKNISLEDLAIKYKIPSSTTISQWILRYNGHDELKAFRTGGYLNMTKGRKTSYDERIEIVKYCIEHQNNYGETAQMYQVSYQQVYSWCKKYETGGVEALLDKRGRIKPENEMTELEKLRAENKLLQAQNRRIQMENDFLKKLEEIERWRS